MPKYLTKRLALAIHHDLIESFGGRHGLLDEGRLEAALELPKSGFGGKERYPTLAAKAAAYLVGVAKGHPFVDGNKRTAFALADTFLRLNGLELTLPDEVLFDLVLDAANCRLDADAVAERLATGLGRLS